MPFVLKKKATFPTADLEKSAKYLLHKHLRITRKARSYSMVHASDLMSSKGEFCPREYALGMKYFKPRPDEKQYTCDTVTFAYGHAVEDLVRGYFVDMGRAWGDWTCRVCKHAFAFQTQPKKCPTCSAGPEFMKYEEVRVQSDYSGVSCGIDLLIDIGNERLKVVEIKSMEAEQFKKLQAPLAEHRFRTNLYMRCAYESSHPFRDRIDWDTAEVLYVVKGGWGSKDDELRTWKLLDGDYSPFKEYDIVRDDDLTETLIQRARLVEVYRHTGILPAGVCPTSVCNRAKFCPQAERCFDENA